jgi:hypothetical protein
MALDGKICLCLHPAGYSANKGKSDNLMMEAADISET